MVQAMRHPSDKTRALASPRTTKARERALTIHLAAQRATHGRTIGLPQLTLTLGLPSGKHLQLQSTKSVESRKGYHWLFALLIRLVARVQTMLDNVAFDFG
jgi:hypothetical protein